jgi:phosphoglycolate phosphatase-like HAD superfamily hydrolase
LTWVNPGKRAALPTNGRRLPRLKSRSSLIPAPAAILFDLDGTLVDTMSAFADVAADVMAKIYGLPLANARRLYLQTSGIPFCQQLEVIFGETTENQTASDEFERRKHDIAASARMDDVTVVGLEALRGRGISLVVSSNGMQEHVDHFAARYDGLFDLALGFGGGLAKGEPHVGAVCRAAGVNRSLLAFVGDSLRDGELAVECGVRFIGRTGTFERSAFERKFPDAPVVDRIDEINDLF